MIRFILVVFLTVINAYSFSYIITTKELNENIEKKFPLEKKIFFSKFVFSHPQLTIDKKSDLILFACDTQSSSFILKDGSTPVFRIYARSDIKYDGENIYLKKIKINKIKNNHLSEKLEKKLTLAVELLLNVYFSKKPIYKLKNTSYTMQTVNSVITDVVIDNEVIKVLILE